MRAIATGTNSIGGAFVEELVSELGPSDEAKVVRYSELFATSASQ